MIEQLTNERHIGAVFVSRTYELANKLRDDLQRVYMHITVAGGERIVLSDTRRTVAAHEEHQNEYYGLEILERSAFVHEQRLAGGVHLLREDVVAVQSACVLAEHLEMPVVRALELIDTRARFPLTRNSLMHCLSSCSIHSRMRRTWSYGWLKTSIVRIRVHIIVVAIEARFDFGGLICSCSNPVQSCSNPSLIERYFSLKLLLPSLGPSSTS